MELGNDDALGAVDHESALRGHEREFAHVNFLFLGAAIVFVAEGHIERGAEGLALALGFQGGHLRLAEIVAYEVERGFILKAVDREKLAEDGLQADIATLANGNILLEKLVVGIDLEFDEVGWLDGLLQFAELDAFRHGGVRCRGLVWPGSDGRVHPPVAGNERTDIGNQALFGRVAMTEP